MKQTARQTQKAQTKELLINSAYTLFSENGILNTRMSDIALAAGVSHGTVFLHFKTQEALIEEVVITYCGKIAERTHLLTESGATLKEILSAHLKGIMEFEPFYTRLVTEGRLLPKGARDAFLGLQSAIAFHIGKAAGRDAGLTGMPVPPDFLFNTWIGLIHHYLANGDLFAPGESVIKRHGEMLVDNFIKLLMQKGE